MPKIKILYGFLTACLLVLCCFAGLSRADDIIYAARVNDKIIPMRIFNARVEMYKKESIHHGIDPDLPEFAETLNQLKGSAIYLLVAEYLFQQDALNRHFQVSQVELERVQIALQRKRLEEAKPWQKQLQYAYQWLKYLDQVHLTQSEIDIELTRQIYWFKLEQQLLSEVKVSESEVLAYYRRHPYSQPFAQARTKIFSDMLLSKRLFATQARLNRLIKESKITLHPDLLPFKKWIWR